MNPDGSDLLPVKSTHSALVPNLYSVVCLHCRQHRFVYFVTALQYIRLLKIHRRELSLYTVAPPPYRGHRPWLFTCPHALK